MEDSNHSSSNVSTSSSTIETASMKDEPGTPKHFTNLDSITSTSYSKSGSISGSRAVQDTFSNDSTLQAGTSLMADDRSGSLANLQAEEDQSGDMGIFHTKRKLHGKDKKICRVCGDKALGYNFNAMTCESCKAFFRRNALKESTPACMFQGNCNVDIRTRRFCPHCRLKKCFSMGMKKEMILENKQKKTKVDNVDLQRKKSKESPQQTQQASSPIEKGTAKPSVMAQSTESRLADQTSPGNESNLKLNPGPSHNRIKRVLTKEEVDKVLTMGKNYQEIIVNSRRSADEDLSEPHGLINMAVLAVEDFVKFLKSVPEFQNLSVVTQTTCLKAHMNSCLTLLAIAAYDCTTDCVVTHGKSIPSDYVRYAFSSFGDWAEKLITMCKTMDRKLIGDLRVKVILVLLLVFNPGGKDLIDHQHLSNTQDQFLILLKHYLESEFSFKEYRKLYCRLLHQLQDIQAIADMLVPHLQQLDPSKLQPLMAELFNFDKKLDELQ